MFFCRFFACLFVHYDTFHHITFITNFITEKVKLLRSFFIHYICYNILAG